MPALPIPRRDSLTQPRQRKARPTKPDTGGRSTTASTATNTATAVDPQGAGAAASAEPAPASDLAPNPAAIPEPASGLVFSSATDSAARQPRPTKIARLQQMLRTPEGASLVQLCEAMGWQAHTLRAALTRLRQAGHAMERDCSEEGITTYRIIGGPAEAAAAAAAAAGATTKPRDGTATKSAEDQGANRGGTAAEMARRGAVSDSGNAPAPGAEDSA